MTNENVLSWKWVEVNLLKKISGLSNIFGIAKKRSSLFWADHQWQMKKVYWFCNLPSNPLKASFPSAISEWRKTYFVSMISCSLFQQYFTTVIYNCSLISLAEIVIRPIITSYLTYATIVNYRHKMFNPLTPGVKVWIFLSLTGRTNERRLFVPGFGG